MLEIMSKWVILYFIFGKTLQHFQCINPKVYFIKLHYTTHRLFRNIISYKIYFL